MAQSIVQYEADLIGWLNFLAILVSLPFFTFYTYETLQGVDDLDHFLAVDPRGQELFSILVRLAVFLALWIPMSVLLKVATYKRSPVLLKTWSVLQILLIFIVALHLLIWRPLSIILVLAYAVAFAYFLVSLWICESLMRELKLAEDSKFRRLDIEDIAHLATVDLDDNNNDNSVSSFLYDSAEFRRTIDDSVANEEQSMQMQMKKIKKGYSVQA